MASLKIGIVTHLETLGTKEGQSKDRNSYTLRDTSYKAKSLSGSHTKYLLLNKNYEGDEPFPLWFTSACKT